MKTKALFCALAAFLLSAILATQSFAAPSAKVGWQRGEAGTTWQEWYFDTQTDPANIPADQGYNPYGTALVTINLDGASDGIDPGWLESRWGRTGIWHSLFTEVNLSIPNSPERNPYKEVWVEVGFTGYLMPNPGYPDFPSDIYGPKLTAYVNGDALPADQITEIGRFITNDTPWPWKKLIIGWRIEPNPDSEDIYLAFHNSGADIDYVIADTKCAQVGEGCTPGYWKVLQHFDSYPSPYKYNTLFVDAFGVNAFPGKTLLQVLWQGGGGLNALGRHAVAALLNSASSGVSYDLTPTAVTNNFQQVFPGTKAEYEALKDVFARYNEQNCPLN